MARTTETKVFFENFVSGILIMIMCSGSVFNEKLCNTQKVIKKIFFIYNKITPCYVCITNCKAKNLMLLAT